MASIQLASPLVRFAAAAENSLALAGGAAATARHSPSSAHRKRTAAHSAGDGQSASIAFWRIELRVTSSVKLRVWPERTKATRCAAIEEEV